LEKLRVDGAVSVFEILSLDVVVPVDPLVDIDSDAEVVVDE